MAVVYEGSTYITIGKDNYGSSVSQSITVPANADYVVVATEWGSDSPTGTISGQTLGGVALAALGSVNSAAITLYSAMQLWGIKAPLTGSRNLTVSFTASPFTRIVTVMYFSGVDQTTPTEGYNLVTGSTTGMDAAPTTTTVSGDMLVGHFLTESASSASLTTLDTEASLGNLTEFAVGVSGAAVQAITGSGAELNWTQASATSYRVQLVVLKAAAAPTVHTKSLSSSLTSTGSIAKKTSKALTGSLGISGTIKKAITKKLFGSIEGSGDIRKAITKSFSGEITGVGNLTQGVSLKVLLEGSMTMQGSIVKTVRKGLSGSLEMSSELRKHISKTVTGSMSMSGTLYKKVSKTLTGSLTLAANLYTSTRTKLSLDGILSPSGSLLKQLYAFVEPTDGNKTNLNFIRRFIGRR